MSCAYGTRAHDWTRRVALRVPGVHRREGDVDRPYRRSPGDLARNGAGAVFETQSLERVRGLRVHPGLRRGVRGEFAHNVWRHGHADLSQARLRLGASFTG